MFASKKKLWIIILAAVLATGGISGGAVWFFSHGKKNQGAHKEVVKIEPPVFVQIDSFTVNLQQENADQYLQIGMSLQVPSDEQVELIKLNMPKVRNRILLLLSSKKSSELNTGEGKRQLALEIVAQVNLPFAEKAPLQEVSDVLFTSFIIQ